jgi:outer membrane protein OmpA-like peptidoglycan-associated protein
MKKFMLMLGVVGFVVAGFAGSAMAKGEQCQYHQWPMHCATKAVEPAVGKCAYYQWPHHICKKEAPAPVVAAPKVEKIVLEGVYFDTGSARIKKESFSVLDANAAKIKNSKQNLQITVVGYTDDRGSDAMNEKLSAARAASVKSYFESKGIDGSRIASMGKGKSNPIADNSTNDGRAKNRRIELETR